MGSRQSLQRCLHQSDRCTDESLVFASSQLFSPPFPFRIPTLIRKSKYSSYSGTSRRHVRMGWKARSVHPCAATKIRLPALRSPTKAYDSTNKQIGNAGTPPPPSQTHTVSQMVPDNSTSHAHDRERISAPGYTVRANNSAQQAKTWATSIRCWR